MERELDNFSSPSDLLDGFSLLGDVFDCFSAAAAFDDFAIPDINCNPTGSAFPAALDSPSVPPTPVGSGTAALKDPPLSRDPRGGDAALLDDAALSRDPLGGDSALLNDATLSCDFFGGVTATLDSLPLSGDSSGDDTAVLEGPSVSCDSFGGLAAAFDVLFFFFFFLPFDLVCDSVEAASDDPAISCELVDGSAAALDRPPPSCGSADVVAAVLRVSLCKPSVYCRWTSATMVRTWRSVAPPNRKFAPRIKVTRGSLGLRRFIWVVRLVSRNERSLVARGLSLGLILTVIFTSGLLSNSVASPTMCLHQPPSIMAFGSFSGGISGSIPSMSRHRIPRVHKSAAVVCGCTSYISGHMYRQSPQGSVLGGPGREAKRKSARTKWSRSLHRMFPGSRLRCTIPLPWRNSNALSICTSTVL